MFYNEHNTLINTNRSEFTEQYLAKKYIKPHYVVLELGARYGTVSYKINSNLNIKTNHLAVEPDVTVWKALDRNKARNSCEFHILKGFISKKQLGLNHCGYGTYSIEDNSTAIQSFTIDDVQSIYDLTFNALVADCEGFLETFFDENPHFIDQLEFVMYEADAPHRCNYNKIELFMKNNGFNLIENIGIHYIWIK